MWSILKGVVAGLIISTPATAAVPEDAALAFTTYCGRSVALWGKSLCGPLLFVDPQTRAALATADAGEGFIKKGNLWTGTLPKSVSVANTSVEVNGTRFAEILLPLPEDPIQTSTLLAHEAYHRIQPDLGFKGVEADNGHLDRKQARILARLEAAALRAALTSKAWRQSARDALSYRAQRLKLAAAADKAEASLIANEGLAEYTGIVVGAAGQARTYAVKALDTVNTRPSLIRSWGYVVGPAYGLLLDRTGRPWRKAALEGEPLPAMLAAAIGTHPALTKPLARYGAPAILAEETARDVKLQQRSAELTATLVSGPTVTFPFQKMSIDFDPNTLFALGDAGTAYSRATRIRDAWGIVTATGDLLISPNWSFARVAGPARAEGSRLSGPGWTAELAAGFKAVPGERPGDLVIKKAQ